MLTELINSEKLTLRCHKF